MQYTLKVPFCIGDSVFGLVYDGERWEFHPEPTEINSFRIFEDKNGKIVCEALDECYCYELGAPIAFAEDCFKSREEAQAECDRRNAELEKEEKK